MENGSNIEALKLLAEQLQLTRTFLTAGNPIEAKVTIILLDSLADSLMYNRCRQEFENDGRLAVIKRPRFSATKRREVLRDFKAKVNLLCSIDFLSYEDGTVFKIGHSYRNAAYHRDVHNPQVTQQLGRLLFMSVCNLVRSYYSRRVSSGGFQPQQWLAEYGLRTDYIEFPVAARTIVTQLLDGVSITLPSACAAFQQDINLRLRKIEERVLELEGWCDEGLKSAEFSDEHSGEEFFAELWEMNYLLATGAGGTVNRDEYIAAEVNATRRRDKAFQEFVPLCSVKVLEHLKKISDLNKPKTVSALLSAYQNLDSTLSRFEISLEQMDAAIDLAAERQSEIERGK